MLRSIEMLRSAPPAVSPVLGDVDRSNCSSAFLPTLLFHVPTMDQMMIAGVVLPIKSPARRGWRCQRSRRPMWLSDMTERVLDRDFIAPCETLTVSEQDGAMDFSVIFVDARGR